MRKSLETVFTQNDWSNVTHSESRSGDGSSRSYTKKLRHSLPELLKKYKVSTFLDAPCGDWNWMQLIDLKYINYIGMDIVKEIVADNRTKFASKNVRFMHGDITSDPLPKADMIMVRDCLFHLKNWLIIEFFKNFYASDIPYLLMTTHFNEVNYDLPEIGQFQRRNFLLAPFRLHPPIELLDDTPDTGHFYKRALGLWPREAIKEAIDRIQVVQN